MGLCRLESRGAVVGEAGMCRVVFLFCFWVLGGILNTRQSQLLNSPTTQHFFIHLSSPTSACTRLLFSDYLYLLICSRLQVVNTPFSCSLVVGALKYTSLSFFYLYLFICRR